MLIISVKVETSKRFHVQLFPSHQMQYFNLMELQFYCQKELTLLSKLFGD